MLSKNLKYTKKVYKKDRREFMLKIIPKRSLFTDRYLRSQVNKEIEIASKIKNHFNYLMPFYEFFYTRNLAVFVYEYFEFGTM